MTLTNIELNYLQNKIPRKLTSVEMSIINAEWSEHCSYKSSKNYLKIIPKKNNSILIKNGHDSGILDIGNGDVLTVHIESHNHPSSIEPFGGAATGVGGVIRDILSSGTRPIALLNGLRFGNPKKSTSKWLFKNVVNGIGYYGNCIGVPTIGGELEFDESYNDYALVDVVGIGLGKKNELVKNTAQQNDIVLLLGNYTGKDGIGGSQFASLSLKSFDDRSAIQIPDPFVKKLLIEVVLDLIHHKYIKAMKDLGGGGLSCAISELADSLSVGIELKIELIPTKTIMTPNEIMISESQERMLIIVDRNNLKQIKKICSKFDISYSVIGKVKSDHMFRVTHNAKTIANLPTHIVANSPLLNRSYKKPSYLQKLQLEKNYQQPTNYSKILIKMFNNPNIASKNWIYNQYDYEVGLRTIIKPGLDASVLKLNNNTLLAIKIDGNPKHCYIDPYAGAMGCFDESCRNIICVGAKPIAMINHMQFGNPEKPEIFWSFVKSINAITKYANHFKIPCIGGKVSFYNDTKNGSIKPSPILGVIGNIINHPLSINNIVDNDILIIIGKTKDELGGSEYFDYIHHMSAGTCPQLDLITSKNNMNALLYLIKNKLVKCIHDCSKGGLSIAISELCIMNKIGCKIFMEKIPSIKMNIDKILFSETNSRYLIIVNSKKLNKIINYLTMHNIIFDVIGNFNNSNEINFTHNNSQIIKIDVNETYYNWQNSIKNMMING